MNQLVNHQKPVRTTRPVTASTTGPPSPRSQGPAQPARAEQPTSTASPISRRSMSLAPRPSSSKARSYRPWFAVAAAIPPRMKNTPAVPVMALEVAAEEVNRLPTWAVAGDSARLPDNGEVNIAQPQRRSWLLACPVIR